MAFENKLIETWRGGGTTYGFWLCTADPWTAQLAAAGGPDLVLLDMQHGLIDERAVVAQIAGVMLGGSAPVVRVAGNDFTLIGKVLDAGALGVVVPMVNDAAEAAAAVRACRYPPAGGRSFGPARIFRSTADARDIERVACIVMIETTAGIANADAIAATPGVDAILIGPSDLAIALGLGPRERSELHESTCERIRAICAARKLPIGMVTDGGVEARAWAQRGFQLVFHASDTGLLGGTAPRELAIARGA